MVEFKAPQIVLFSRDIERAVDFYKAVGFEEAFRTPVEGTPIHVDLMLDRYRIGLATETSTRDDHGLSPVAEGQRAAVILWTDDTRAGYERLQQLGARPVKSPNRGWIDTSSRGLKISTDTWCRLFRSRSPARSDRCRGRPL
jgi:catechol 2,3-dioxygenase-like lactoylglutathione lyase family enzyme